MQLTLQPRDAKLPSESFSYPVVRALDDQRDLFDGAAGFSSYPFDVGDRGAVRRVSGALVTGGYYETLGVNAAAGRLLRRDDDVVGGPVTAVISDGFWQRGFARDPDVVGRAMTLNGAPATIVGVSAPGFVGANVGFIADVTIPVAALPQVTPQAAPLLGPGNFWLRVLARPHAGLGGAEIASRLNVLWPRIADALIAPQWPTSRRQAMADSVFRAAPGGTGWTPLREMYVTPLVVLTAIVALVLLIACANVASLQLARASARRREIAVRLALGAGRGRIVRQLLIESLLLAAMGAACGLAIAVLAGRFIVELISTGRVRVVFDLTPNAHVVAFTSGVAVATAVIFGIVPALHATSAAPSAGLSDDARTSTSRSRLLPALVSAQVALSLVLAVGASLFIRTLQNLERFDPGFDARGVLLVDFEGRRTSLPQDLVDALRAIYEALGLKDPRTYVQSGNVIFRTKEKSTRKLAIKIQDAIEKSFKFRPAVIVRTLDELREAIAATPFDARRNLHPGKVLVTFLEDVPQAEGAAKLATLKSYPEEIHLLGRELYIYFPDGAGKSKLPWSQVEKLLKVNGTARNWNSVRAMLEIAEKLEAE